LESLLAIGALIVIGFPIAVIYLLFSNAGLRRRVAALEEHKAHVARPASSDVSAPEAIQSPQPAVTPAPAAAIIKHPETERALPPKAIIQPAGPPRAVVMTTEKFQLLLSWVLENWFYVIAAVSLALAGIFLVIYGMEQGLLPPSVRIIAALLFGGILIGVGEFIRRRFGDGEESSTAYLPSTFSGAGIVTLFGAILAARLLYGFTSAEIALTGMAAVGTVAMVLGWFYGPFLAAIGIIGAMVAPFIVGGSSEDVTLLIPYFAIVVIVGLAIDTLRRWAWISVLSLVGGFVAGVMLMTGPGGIIDIYLIMYFVVLVLVAIAIPIRKLVPDHGGTLISMAMFARGKDTPWPEFPTRLAAGAVIAASGLITVIAIDTSRFDLFYTSVFALSGLVLALLIWARNAGALVDLTVFPAAALCLVVAGGRPLWNSLQEAALAPEGDLPWMASQIVAIGLILSIAAAWRSLQSLHARLFVALGAALLAPVLAITLEVFLQPATLIGPYNWALHGMVIAAVMVVMAERFARVDGPDRRNRMSFAVLSALACVSFSMVILFTTSALTAAISITVVAAARLDLRFNLPLMGIYILVGITTIGYRLVVDPGLPWARMAPLPEFLISHGGAVVAFTLAYLLVKAAKRARSQVLLESALLSSSGIFLGMLILRWIENMGGVDAAFSHWNAGVSGTIWLALGIAQLHRLQLGGSLKWVRLAFALGFLAIAAIHFWLGVTLFSPLSNFSVSQIVGPPLLNTLIPAYLLPALVMTTGALKLPSLAQYARYAFFAGGAGLAILWLGLTIRHSWRGATGMELPGIDQPELYSYTVVLLIAGAGTFYQSLARQDGLLRKVGLVIIGLAVAKMFFIDIRGLGGLIRVFAFLFLGLSLAGLALLNRWAAGRSNKPSDT